jgi:two-component system, OmpR family, phosphate regulon sensor histidine kinase PhoR
VILILPKQIRNVRRRIFDFLTYAIPLLFVALIAVQSYWLMNALMLSESQFRNSAQSALERVGEKIIREAEMGKLRNVQVERGMRIPGADSGINESVVPIIEGQKDIKNNRVDKTSGTPNPIKDSEMINRGEIIKDLRGELDPGHVDSLLKVHFRHKQINLPFEFAVFSPIGVIEIASGGAQEFISELSNPELSVDLLVPEWGTGAHRLSVHFPDERSYVLRGMSWVGGITLVLLILMLFGFFFMSRTNQQMRKASAAKTAFINNMTHELKTPIATIQLASEALSDSTIDKSEEMRKSFISMINDENKRLGILVENVLRNAQLDQGDVVLKSDRLNMHEIIREALKNGAIQAKRHGGSLRFEPEAANPIVLGDNIHLTNMVYNLIDNGLKYGGSSPELVIRTQNTATGLQITFTDNGIGIPKEHLKRIFERFYRVPTGDIHNVKGFGLGLSYVKEIVERHKGEINVSSEINQGTTFKITFPNEQ